MEYGNMMKLFESYGLSYEIKQGFILALSLITCFGIGLLPLFFSLRVATLIFICIITIITIFFVPYYGVLFVIFLYYVNAADIKYMSGTEYLRPMYYLIATLVLFWMIDMIVHRKYRFVNSAQNFMILGLISSMIISTFTAVASREISWSANLKFLKIILFFLLLTNLSDTIKKVNFTYWTIGMGCGVLSLLGVKYYIICGGRVEFTGGQLDDSNLLAHMLVMILPFFFYKMFSKNKIEKYTAISFFPIVLSCLIFTMSRGGFLGLLGSLILIPIRAKRKIKSLILITIIILLGTLFAPQEFKERIRGITYYKEDESAMSRITMWKAGIQMWKDHPLTGVGQDNFIYVVERYLPSEVKGQQIIHVAHNTYITFLAEGGIFSLLFYLLIIFFNFKDLQIIRKLANEEVSGIQIHNLTYALEVGFVGSLISAFFINRTDFEPFFWFTGLITSLKNIIKKQIQTQ